jgi:hypothetical protein
MTTVSGSAYEALETASRSTCWTWPASPRTTWTSSSSYGGDAVRSLASNPEGLESLMPR